MTSYRYRGCHVDDVAVRRRIDGDRSVVLNVREREAAVRILTRRGVGSKQQAAVIGVTWRTVQRIRQRLGIAGPRPAHLVKAAA